MKDLFFKIFFWIITITFCGCLFFCAYELYVISSSDDFLVLDKSQKNTFILFFLASLVSGIAIMALLFAMVVKLKKTYQSSQLSNNFAQNTMKAIESSREGISILNSQGDYIYMNDAHARIYGYENKNDLISQNWRSLYSEREQDIFKSIMHNDLVKTGWWAGHGIGRKKDGQEFPQEVSLTMLDDGGMICVVKDISDYIQKENTMQIIKMAIDSATDGIFIIDQNHKFVFFNSSFLKIHDIESHNKMDILDCDWRTIYTSKEQSFINSTILPKAVLKGTWNGQMVITTKENSDIYTNLSLTKLPNNLMLGVIRDETQRMALEVEREKIKNHMYQSQKAETITRLIKGMGEDFKNSISVIKENIERAFSYDDVPVERRKYMTNILSAANNANEKILHLLSLSEGKNINSGRVDAVDVSLSVNNDMVRKYQKKAIFSIESKLDNAIIFADAEQFKNALEGLCLNAMESVGDDIVKVSIIVSDTHQNKLSFYNRLVSSHDFGHHDLPQLFEHHNGHIAFCGYLKPSTKYIQISVCDNGAGISVEALPNVFDPFFTTKMDGTSSGVRLSAIKGMVLSLKGAVAVESTVGKGTSVHLFIPSMPA